MASYSRHVRPLDTLRGTLRHPLYWHAVEEPQSLATQRKCDVSSSFSASHEMVSRALASEVALPTVLLKLTGDAISNTRSLCWQHFD